MLKIINAETDTELAEARDLFREYETSLQLDLCFQGFEEELRSLPGKYALPDGRLLLAYHDEKLVGCVALRKLEDGIGEMKRLFVRDEFRGHKVGITLIERLLADAREIGYKTLRLDTHPPKMGKAMKLYESLGFLPVAPYYDNPNDDVLFMELAL